MTKEEQKKLQKKQMEILDEIDKICKKHKIKYSLDAGTLLGAIRHNGFIPWDDDADILMTRDNYNKFLKIAEKELPENYFIQTPSKEHDYPHTFTKLRLNNTLLVEKINVGKNFHQGIFVDIFPYDYAGNTLLGAKLKTIYIVSLRTLLLKKLGYPVKGRSFIQKIVIGFLSIFAKFTNSDKLKRKIEKSLLNNKKKTKYIASLTGNSLFNAIMRTSIFDKYTTHKFENKEYSIIKDYDEYLHNLYGDYMTPPEQKEREIGHGVIKVEFNTKK
ncbi:MAG: LicD family protein [Firmicutes bacterium]|nr:LicD family protein [Bacillota bacterium]